MNRGDLCTVAGGPDYAGKPRPAVIIQDDRFDTTKSITICTLTTNDTDALLFRVPIEPSAQNGLRSPCRLMIDKITTLPRTKVGERIGRLDDTDIMRLNQAITVFLGLAVSPRAGEG